MGEGIALEFKRSAAHLGREICAFANSAGGTILLGVDDDGTTVGVSNINRAKSEVQNIARAMAHRDYRLSNHVQVNFCLFSRIGFSSS